MLALVEANKDGKYDEVLKKAENFLRGLQWMKVKASNPPTALTAARVMTASSVLDMSNNQFFIEALKVSELRQMIRPCKRR